MNNIDIHADDYGYTLNTSKSILECIKNGALDSFSIICNTSFYEESIELLYKEIPSLPFLPLMSIHLNLVEGFNLSNSLLISRNGINNLSWIKILSTSIGKERDKLKKQVKKEIKLQIDKTQTAISRCIELAKKNGVPTKQKGIRVDSHIHTHSIPLVFEALVEVIKEENYQVEYIRNPKEPLFPFVKNFWITFSPINYMKNIVLNIFSKKIDKYSINNKLPLVYMWGLIMSGNMDYERIYKIMPNMMNKSKNRHLEILFHPGLALTDELRKELNDDYMSNFNESNNRNIEKNAVLRIKSIIKER